MNKIKKFSDFMGGVGSNIRRSMNHLVIEGSYKSWFLGKPKSFELHIYYTPMKGTIVDIKFYSDDNMTLESLRLDFKIGDSIEFVRKWIEKNNYKIVIDFKRL